jgi:hypothetical protein
MLVAVMASLLVPVIVQAAETSPSLYDCRARDPQAADPPPQPDLPPKMDAVLAEAIASDDFEQICPAGEVPEPTGTKAVPEKILAPTVTQSAQAGPVRARRNSGRRHGRGASTSREYSGGFWYSWAMGRQAYSSSKNVNAFFISQTNEQPYIDFGESTAGAHSLGQLWTINRASESCYSTTETGWSESQGQFGDVNPHLFVHAFDCGAAMGYAGKGLSWVQSSGVIFPNSTLSHNDVFHVYGAKLDGNNWWIYYDGQWVGYIPNGAWAYHFPWRTQEAEAGGEVSTPNIWTCTDMGYGGLYGTHPWAAMVNYNWIEYNWSTQSAWAYLSGWANDPNAYVTGNWNSGGQGTNFRYGGPGYC